MSTLRYDPSQRPGPMGLRTASSVRRGNPACRHEFGEGASIRRERAVVPVGRRGGEERGGQPAAID